jgi:hypothetical protein
MEVTVQVFRERYVKCRRFRAGVPREAVSTGRGAS